MASILLDGNVSEMNLKFNKEASSAAKHFGCLESGPLEKRTVLAI